MIRSISQARFERRYQPKIPNPELVLQHWYEDTGNKNLGFVAWSPSLQSWGAAVLKKQKGVYKIWRQAAPLATEKEALTTLVQLFGFTDRGYQEALAEQEFLTAPGEEMQFLIHSHWGFDPDYDAETRARLDKPITNITLECFREIYPQLQGQLQVTGSPTAAQLQTFPTPCTALGEPVVGLIRIIATAKGDPRDITIFVGREKFILEKRRAITEQWKGLKSKHGDRAELIDFSTELPPHAQEPWAAPFFRVLQSESAPDPDYPLAQMLEVPGYDQCLEAITALQAHGKDGRLIHEKLRGDWSGPGFFGETTLSGKSAVLGWAFIFFVSSDNEKIATGWVWWGPAYAETQIQKRIKEQHAQYRALLEGRDIKE